MTELSAPVIWIDEIWIGEITNMWLERRASGG